MSVFNSKYIVTNKKYISDFEEKAIHRILSDENILEILRKDSEILSITETVVTEGINIFRPTLYGMLKEYKDKNYITPTTKRVIVLTKIFNKIEYDCGHPKYCWKGCPFSDYNRCVLFNENLLEIDGTKHQIRTIECIALRGISSNLADIILDFNNL